MRKHKIVGYILAAIIALVTIVLVVGLFSWDSLLGWIITKDKSELDAFIFWTIFAVVLIIVSIVISIAINRKKK
ncbi:MAG: hypothetical protein PHH84_00475 [Oscillospiraceae bacterium]|mgnify:CR=1 FL=1|nr:hypothetical protein [Oscillospiraceae bacterium]MDD4413056.1 hypothetical protein [Oscillospiraceae bacterium]